MSGAAAELAGIAARALEYVHPGDVVGLGTGRAACAFVAALGARVKTGLAIRGVATSQATETLARSLGIEMLSLADAGEIAVTLDGADEVDPNLDLIKGYGGALVREKIVAASSRQRVMLVGAEKMVDVLGRRGKLPVEIVPFAAPLCDRALRKLGCVPVLRKESGTTFVTDNGNWILDCGIAPLSDPERFEQDLREIPGVVGSGLFLGMADVVLIQDGQKVEARERRR